MAQDAQQRRRGAVTIGLALIAGYVDGVGFLVLFHMFTSHTSGNTVGGAVQFGSGNHANALHRLMPLPAFMLGVFVGRALVDALYVHRCRAPLGLVLVVEAGLLGLFRGCGNLQYHDGGLHPESETAFDALAALPALAMGLQNAILRRVGGKTVRTTYITGMLTDCADGLVDYLYWRAGRHFDPPLPSLGRLVLLLALRAGYFGGGVLGALAEHAWAVPCLFVPIATPGTLAALDLVLPFSRQLQRPS